MIIEDSAQSSIKGKTVLISGGLGFIGSHLARRLLKEECKIHLIGLGREDNISDIIKQVSIHRVNLSDADALKLVVANIKPNVIYHLASIVDPSRNANKNLIIKSNFNSTVNLLSAVESIDYDCFVNTGSSEEYGDGIAPFDEQAFPRPVSPYSVAKLKSTLYCQEYHKRTGKPIVTLRPFLTYGPYQKNILLIPYLITSSLMDKRVSTTKGEQSREFNYVTDIVEGFVLAASCKEAIGEIINLGTSVEYTVRSLISRLQKLLPIPLQVDDNLPYRSGEVMHFYSNNEKARKLLGWSPKISLDEGLKITVDWYVEQKNNGQLSKWITA